MADRETSTVQKIENWGRQTAARVKGAVAADWADAKRTSARADARDARIAEAVRSYAKRVKSRLRNARNAGGTR